MKEYLISRPGDFKSTRFLPAHLLYKIANGKLLRQQTPLSLRGGIMVIDVEDEPEISLAKRIVAECLKFNFDGVLISLPPVPGESATAFAEELLSLLAPKGIPLFLPLTYSACRGANMLVPGISTMASFKDYLLEVAERFSPQHLALQLTLQPLEFKMLEGQIGIGSPIHVDTLRQMLTDSGAMTFYSPDFCSNYFTHGKSFIVYDTPETLDVKRKIAEGLGFKNCFYLISPKNKCAIQKLETII